MADIILLIIGLFVGYLFGIAISEETYQKEAIEVNCAYYHPETAEFTWKENESKMDNTFQRN